MLLEPSTQPEESANPKLYDKEIKSWKPAIVNKIKVFINKCRKFTKNAEEQANLEYIEGLACWYSSDFSGAEKHFQNSLLQFQVIY